jgi:hypothetical protein
MDNSTPINKVNGIYLDLDAILDTRLGLLFNISPDLAKDVITHGYKNRDEDIFPGISKARFVELYANRNKSVLINATITSVIKFVDSFIIDIIKNTINTPMVGQPIIYLNIYPYQLVDVEKKLIGNAIGAATKGWASIELINVDPKLITPSFLKEKVGVAIMYEYHNWLRDHVENLKRDPSPGLGLLGPMLYFGDKPNNEKIAEISKAHGSPFKAMEEMSAPVIGLYLVPVEHFSIIF